MSLSQLLNEILAEWAYRVDDGMPNPKNPIHLKELGIVLSEMGLSHIKNELVENLLTEKGKTPEKHVKEAEGTFKNPVLNKKVKYKNAKGEDAEGIVGNLLRLPADHPGRKAAEALLPPEGSDERDSLNKDLGGQNQPAGSQEPKADKGGEKGGAPQEDPIKKAAALFDPKADPAMAARLDKEKETLAQLAGDKEAEKPAEEPKKEEPKGFNPVPAQDVKDEIPQADPDTFGGQSDIPDGVDKKDLNQFNTDIQKVAEKVRDAKAKGKKIDINLCDVTVPGTNLYCDDNLGIKRKDMPQFKGKPVPGSRAEKMPLNKDGEVDTEPVFREMLKKKGIKTTQTEVAADQLKATQSELGGDKVIGMMGALEENPQHPSITAPIFVSRDGFVIDGHHRWAAIVAYNAAHPEAQIPMKVEVIDKDIKDAIEMCNEFAQDIGIAAKKQGETTGTVGEEPKAAEVKPNEKDPESNVKSFKGEKSGKDIKTVEFEGGGMLFGTEHRNEGMVDDIINQVKATVPKEKWKDIVFVGEGGATGENGELEFHDEVPHAVDQFKEMGAGIDTFDGDELDVHNDQSELYKSQEEQTGLSQSKIKAGNWASMIGQGEGTDTMSPADFLDDEGKEFLQNAAKEAGFPPIQNWDNPSEKDKDTLYRLSFPEDNGDRETGVNTVQVAFNKARDLNLIKKQKELSSQGKIPVVIAGEGHADLVDDILKGKKEEPKPEETPTEKLPEPKEPSTEDGGVVYSLGGGYYSDTPKGPAQYRVVESIVDEVLIEGNESLAYLLFEATVTKKTSKGKTVKLKTIEPRNQKSATKIAKAKNAKSVSKEKPAKKQPKKVDPTEGETIKELSNEEINSILEKYVNSGEATPDEMRPLANNYSEEDMAEGYSDDDFYSKEHQAALLKQKIKVRKKPYKVDSAMRSELKKAGFPEKYIKFLERCINTQVNGKKPKVTELIKQGGAGQIQSQFGEVMAMAFMSIRDPKAREKFALVLSSEIENSINEFGGGKNSPIATQDWVEASLTHAEAFDSAMDEKYGKGQWRFEGAAWDIKGDIESLGLDYKNKGFSTDVMLRVQPLKNGKPNGPARAQKNSLKKDENIFFFNGSINEINNFLLNFVDENKRNKVRGYEAIVTKGGASNKNKEERLAAIKAAERITGLQGQAAIKALKEMASGIRDEAFNKAPKEVQDAVSKVRNFGAAQTLSAEKLIKGANTTVKNPNNVIDNAKNIDAGDKDFAKFAYKAVKDCKASGAKDITLCIRQKLSAAGDDTTDDRVCKVAVMATKVAIAAGDTNAEKSLNKHYNLAIEAGNALMAILPESPELMGGLMQKLADAFPMKTCMDGEEFMCIDGMKVTQKTLQTVFGVASYEELQKGMKLKRMPNGETVLVYGAKDKNGQDIPIGVVRARQKGKGYEGTVGFEISCSDDFALAIAEANTKNGDKSASNESARQSIGKRVAGRKKNK